MNFPWTSKRNQKSSSPVENEEEQAVTLLVIQSDRYDWNALFAGCRLRDGRAIRVVQTGWDSILLHADSPLMASRAQPLALVHIRDSSNNGRARTIQPDFVLVRNEARDAEHTRDYRNVLFGLMYAGIPSVNSLESIYSFLERPIVQGELHKIQRRLGNDRFPVIPQSYYSAYATMMYGRPFPAVLKVGHAHAGAGKMRVANHHDWEDVRSVVCLTDGKYCTAEPFLNGAYDLRIQKIGRDHYRAFRRQSVSGDWKTNSGCAIIEPVEMTDRYKEWVDESSKMFGGLDICTVDVIHDSETDQEYILEVNGTSSGLLPDCADEDNGYIRDVVLEKMNCVLVSANTV